MVSGAVILLVLNTQFQAQRSAAEQTIAYSARKSTLQMADVIEREFTLIGNGSSGAIDTLITNANGETSTFRFYRQDGGGADMLVEYRLLDEGSVDIRGEPVPLYRLERYENGALAGGGPATIRTFRIDLLDEDGDPTDKSTVRLVRVRLIVAYPFGSSDDAYLFQSHWGITLRPLSLS